VIVRVIGSNGGFLQRLLKATPFQVTKVLTDNGREFTEWFCSIGQRQPTGKHPFDQVCADHAIDYRLIKPRHPQTNGTVERFNGRTPRSSLLVASAPRSTWKTPCGATSASTIILSRNGLSATSAP
jgi:transposase InsO family protein